MTEEKIHKNRPGNWWALSPLLVFLCLYLVTSILVNDFYKVPITVAFLVSRRDEKVPITVAFLVYPRLETGPAYLPILSRSCQ